uniref:Uncharacterized protein n=1 Tax=Anguilla anguilla TaxID=7936 RepID=A0A0E9R6Y6_ANGAN
METCSRYKIKILNVISHFVNYKILYFKNSKLENMKLLINKSTSH